MVSLEVVYPHERVFLLFNKWPFWSLPTLTLWEYLISSCNKTDWLPHFTYLKSFNGNHKDQGTERPECDPSNNAISGPFPSGLCQILFLITNCSSVALQTLASDVQWSYFGFGCFRNYTSVLSARLDFLPELLARSLFSLLSTMQAKNLCSRNTGGWVLECLSNTKSWESIPAAEKQTKHQGSVSCSLAQDLTPSLVS